MLPASKDWFLVQYKAFRDATSENPCSSVRVSKSAGLAAKDPASGRSKAGAGSRLDNSKKKGFWSGGNTLTQNSLVMAVLLLSSVLLLLLESEHSADAARDSILMIILSRNSSYRICNANIVLKTTQKPKFEFRNTFLKITAFSLYCSELCC